MIFTIGNMALWYRLYILSIAVMAANSWNEENGFRFLLSTRKENVFLIASSISV